MKDWKSGKKWVRWILPAVSAAVLVFYAYFIFCDYSFNKRFLPMITMLCVSVLALNIFTWRLVGRVFQKMRIAREEELTKRRMEHIVSLSKQTHDEDERALRLHHDLKNHLGVLYSLLKDGNVRQADGYVKQLQAFLGKEDVLP
jgi:ABC-type siderophore export system fused ATPase/permease subunit